MSPLERKRLRQKTQIQAGIRLARHTGGCEICFKAYDPNAPSCHQAECRIRWEQRATAMASTKEAQQ